MKSTYYLLSLVILLLLCFSCTSPTSENSGRLLAKGRQPQLAVAADGTIRVVFGQEDGIYCATSTDNGNTFSEPVLIDKVPGLLTGMSMGPQIASSATYTVVTAIDKKGNIHSFSLKHEDANWVKAADVNDVPEIAAEGLMSIACDDNDTFYALWLDVRNNKKNKIVLASATGPATKWSANHVIYESPDSTVCECCKPNIIVNDKDVIVMFRNWLQGSRDFYTMTSADGGKTFAEPHKLGQGTWKVEGCPMDGGGLVRDESDNLHTVWQRDGKIFYAQPGKPEVEVGEGRNCRISGGAKPVISWKDNDELKVKFLHSDKVLTVGKGSYIETIKMPDNTILCVWEKDRELFYKKI